MGTEEGEMEEGVWLSVEAAAGKSGNEKEVVDMLL